MALRYAYNTNGCANHRLYDALDLIERAGYDGVALTLDWHHLDPFAEDWKRQTLKLRQRLRDGQLGCVIETGARYLLDPHQKHEPTLLHPEIAGRNRRLEFLRRAVDIAALLDAEAVSFWAGVRQPTVSKEDAWRWLHDGVSRLAEYAERSGVTLALEPEPGMQIELLSEYEQLRRSVGPSLRLALDVGHLWVTGEQLPEKAVCDYADQLGTVAIEGMDRGVHVHLPIGEGDMSLPPILAALQSIDLKRLICVELSRESPRAHLAIPQSISRLKAMEKHLRTMVSG